MPDEAFAPLCHAMGLPALKLLDVRGASHGATQLDVRNLPSLGRLLEG
jgi:hypothetical protein